MFIRLSRLIVLFSIVMLAGCFGGRSSDRIQATVPAAAYGGGCAEKGHTLTVTEWKGYDENGMPIASVEREVDIPRFFCKNSYPNEEAQQRKEQEVRCEYNPCDEACDPSTIEDAELANQYRLARSLSKQILNLDNNETVTVHIQEGFCQPVTPQQVRDAVCMEVPHGEGCASGGPLTQQATEPLTLSDESSTSSVETSAGSSEEESCSAFANQHADLYDKQSQLDWASNPNALLESEQLNNKMEVVRKQFCEAGCNPNEHRANSMMMLWCESPMPTAPTSDGIADNTTDCAALETQYQGFEDQHALIDWTQDQEAAQTEMKEIMQHKYEVQLKYCGVCNHSINIVPCPPLEPPQ